MNSDEKFEQIYSTILKHNLNNLELSRENATKENWHNKIIIMILIFIGIAMFFILSNILYPNYGLVKLIELIYIVISLMIYIKIKPTRKRL